MHATRLNERGRWQPNSKQSIMKQSMAHPIDLVVIMLGLGLAFQVGHFTEHAVQFGVWVAGNLSWVDANFCGRNVPYMSPLVTEFVRLLGFYLFPTASSARQMMVAMELLHLIGNIIFLSTIAG